jgi:hypothetical protein
MSCLVEDLLPEAIRDTISVITVSYRRLIDNKNTIRWIGRVRVCIQAVSPVSPLLTRLIFALIAYSYDAPAPQDPSH